MSISSYIGRINTFEEITLRDEISTWNQFTEKVTTKIKDISDSGNIHKEWYPLLDSLREFPKVWDIHAEMTRK